MEGGLVCGKHGGRAPQVRAKAQRRLAEATDTMARALLKMATDDNVADAVKLTAIRDALDRGGVVAKTAVEVGVSVKPFEAILESMDGGSRAQHRRSVGIDVDEEPKATLSLPPPEDYEDDVTSAAQPQEYLIVDADVELDAEVFTPVDDDENGSAFDSEPDSSPFGGPLGPTGPAGGGMMPLADAVAAQAEMRRAAQAQARSAVLRPIQRALPRGRS